MAINIDYSPQVNPDPVTYTWDVPNETLTATVGTASDTFDFSTLANNDKVTETTTTLPYSPVVAAARDSVGDLYITLLYTYAHGEPNSKPSETL